MLPRENAGVGPQPPAASLQHQTKIDHLFQPQRLIWIRTLLSHPWAFTFHLFGTLRSERSQFFKSQLVAEGALNYLKLKPVTAFFQSWDVPFMVQKNKHGPQLWAAPSLSSQRRPASHGSVFSQLHPTCSDLLPPWSVAWWYLEAWLVDLFVSHISHSSP